MSDEVTALISGNSHYQDNYVRNKFLYDSYIGGNSYKRGRYLTRYQLETDNEYQARIDATPLDNQCASIIATFTSFLFKEEPRRDYGSLASLPELEDFLKDADFEGRGLDIVMKDVSTWNQVFGHCWVLITKPNISATSKADEIILNVRPYLSVVTPLTVLDWNYEREINGKYSLSYLKYVEEINGDVQTIKEWDKTNITTSVVDINKKQIEQVTIEPNELGVVPAVCSYNKRSIVRGYGVSAINDIADMQRFIYNCYSEVYDSIRLDSHPSLVKTEDTMAGVGAGAIIQMPENLDGNLKPYVLDFAGANIDNIYNAINNTVSAIEKSANVGSVRSNVSTVQSGISKAMEFQLLNSTLGEKADNLQQTEEEIWRLFATYQGQPYDMSIEYPGSFNLRDTKSDIEELKLASECGSTDIRVRAVLDAKLLDYLDVDEDEYASIMDRTLLNPDSTPEAGELPPEDKPLNI